MEKYNKDNFNIAKGIAQELAIWCDTNDKAISFINYLADNGYKWCSGILERTTHWDKYKENTCYVLQTNAASIDARSCIFFDDKQQISNLNELAQYISGTEKHKIVKWEV